MGNWYCKCGNRMSDGLAPTPHGYEVFTNKQCCDGDLDKQRAYADAYICPECGRIMVFGRDADRYLLYRPEPIENIDGAAEEVRNTNESFKPGKAFSNEAWSVYSALSEKEDIKSVETVSDINKLLLELQNSGIRELSVRNKLVGSEHQICYRVHEGTIEIISIEWIFE